MFSVVLKIAKNAHGLPHGLYIFFFRFFFLIDIRKIQHDCLLFLVSYDYCVIYLPSMV